MHSLLWISRAPGAKGNHFVTTLIDLTLLSSGWDWTIPQTDESGLMQTTPIVVGLLRLWPATD